MRRRGSCTTTTQKGWRCGRRVGRPNSDWQRATDGNDHHDQHRHAHGATRIHWCAGAKAAPTCLIRKVGYPLHRGADYSARVPVEGRFGAVLFRSWSGQTDRVPGPGRLAEQIRTLLNIEIIVLVIKLSMFKLMKSMDYCATASDYIWVDLHATFHN